MNNKPKRLIKCWAYCNYGLGYPDGAVICHPTTGNTPLETRTNLIKSVIMYLMQCSVAANCFTLNDLLYLFINNEESAHSYREDNKKRHEDRLDDMAKVGLFVAETLDGEILIIERSDGGYFRFDNRGRYVKYRIKAGTKDELEQVKDSLYSVLRRLIEK